MIYTYVWEFGDEYRIIITSNDEKIPSSKTKKKCKRKAVVNTNTDIINTDKLYWRVRYRNFMCDEAGEKEG